MKKVLYIFLNSIFCLCIFSPSQAQEDKPAYKPFKMDVGINMTFPTSNSELTAGGGLFVEPRYGLTDQFHLGLQLGTNILGEGDFILNNANATINAQTITNLSLTSEYHLSQKPVRPYIGIMTGLYRRSDYEIVDSDDGNTITKLSSETRYGFAPRIGLVARKFRLNVTYHFTGNNISNFFNIGMGIQFGGGKANP